MLYSAMRTTRAIDRLGGIWVAVVVNLAIALLPLSAQDNRDGIPVRQNQSTATARVQSAAWTSATGDETSITVTVRGHGAMSLSFDPSGSITAGNVTFECNTTAAGTFFSVLATRSDAYVSESGYALSGTKKLWQRSTAGY